MSDTSDRIARLLEDPDSIKMIAQIAESFIGEETNDTNEGNESKEESQIKENSVGIIKKEGENNSSELSSFLNLIEKNLSAEDIDNTINLIQALQPYLGHRRYNKAQTVLRILRSIKAASRLNLSSLTAILETMGQ